MLSLDFSAFILRLYSQLLMPLYRCCRYAAALMLLRCRYAGFDAADERYASPAMMLPPRCRAEAIAAAEACLLILPITATPPAMFRHAADTPALRHYAIDAT